MVSRTEACTRTNHVATQDNDKLFQLSEEIGITLVDYAEKILVFIP